MRGEVLTRLCGRNLPETFRITDSVGLFDIHDDLRHHQIQEPPHYDEIIVSLHEPSGKCLCCFLRSQVHSGSRLRAALDDLVQRIQRITEPAGGDEPPPSVSV